MLLCYVITLVDCNETFETADGDPEEEYHCSDAEKSAWHTLKSLNEKEYDSSDEEKYKSAWRALKTLKKQEHIQSLTPEQRQKYDESEAKWSKWVAKHPRCTPS